MAQIIPPKMNVFNYGQAVEQGNRNALAQQQIAQMPEKLQMDRERFGMQKQGFETNQRTAQLQQAQIGLNQMLQKGQFVTDQPTYDQWGREMVDSGVVQPGQLDPTYNPNNMNKYLGMAQDKLSDMTAQMKNYMFRQQLSADEQGVFDDVMRNNYQLRDVAGVPTVVDVRPGGGQTKLSTLEDEASAAAEKEKSKKVGIKTGESIDKAINESGKIRANNRSLEKVIKLVEDGAESGPLARRLPSFRAASVRLDQLRNQLGLDVVGAVTFGALSKGELDLALDTALPTGLDGPELAQWARDKITAQEKLANYLEEQAIFLSKPGNTQVKWLEQQKGMQPPQNQPKPQPGAIEDGYRFKGGDPADPNNWERQ